MLETLEAHDKKALDTAINNLRIDVIARCKEAITKCKQITAAR
jgi:hypothetical protein